MTINIEIPEQEEPKDGWTLSYKWLSEFQDYLRNKAEWGDYIFMELLEEVILALKDRGEK